MAKQKIMFRCILYCKACAVSVHMHPQSIIDVHDTAVSILLTHPIMFDHFGDLFAGLGQAQHLFG
jgi:hypothetical protein